MYLLRGDDAQTSGGLTARKYIKAISYAKVKTDAVDASALATLLRNDLLPQGHTISAAHREERDLLRARLRLVPQQVRWPATTYTLPLTWK
ncbi:MAG: hypothetical protein AABZ80_04360 [Gemmatimonadota bacterium]